MVRGTADPSASLDFLLRIAASVEMHVVLLKRTTSVAVVESSEAGNPGTPGACDFYFLGSLLPENPEQIC